MTDQAPREKKNVAVFERDVLANQGYRYTTSARLSTRFSNARTTRALGEATRFSGRRVLDIGCGDGAFTLELAGFGAASVLGVDPAVEAVRRAGERVAGDTAGVVSFAVHNVYDLDPTVIGHFDIVVLRGVLHHLPDPCRAVAIAVSLADEVLILEPNGANPVLKLIEKLSPYHREHEEQSFLPRTLQRWLREAGAEVGHRQFLNLVPIFCPDAAARVLKWLEPLVERLPGIRVFALGQYLVLGRRAVDATAGRHPG